MFVDEEKILGRNTHMTLSSSWKKMESPDVRPHLQSRIGSP